MLFKKMLMLSVLNNAVFAQKCFQPLANVWLLGVVLRISCVAKAI